MNQADQDYLLHVENREAVVRTLKAKIIEREQDEYDGESFANDEFYPGEKDMEEERQKLGLCHRNLEM